MGGEDRERGVENSNTAAIYNLRGKGSVVVDPAMFEMEEGEISEDMDVSLSPEHETTGHLTATPSKSENPDVQASVRVSYTSLTRASKKRLDELLRIWSEWHAQHSFSTEVSKSIPPISTGAKEELESGESTYFPALSVGLQSSVTFVEDKTRFVETPFYDRKYAYGLSNIEGGVEILGNFSRCFNCGSYEHSLKECSKPRDSVAVNNARKEFKSKKSLTVNAVRYYEPSFSAKFGGLTPGVLHPETREALGLRELDPPPWFQRMQELGYPPGYLEADEENRPSGITIFGEENDDEDGKFVEPKRKMSVDFPGVNSPIPENADESLWREREPPRSTVFNRLSRRSTRDDGWYEGPPGVGTPPHSKRVRMSGCFDPSLDSVVRYSRRGGGDYSSRR